MSTIELAKAYSRLRIEAANRRNGLPHRYEDALTRVAKLEREQADKGGQIADAKKVWADKYLS